MALVFDGRREMGKPSHGQLDKLHDLIRQGQVSSEQLQAFLENPNQFRDGILEKLVKLCDVKFLGPNISSAELSVMNWPDERNGMQVLSFSHSTMLDDGVLTDMASRGLVPAEIEYGCLFIMNNPGWIIDRAFVCPGTVYTDAQGRRSVPVFSGLEGRLRLELKMYESIFPSKKFDQYFLARKDCSGWMSAINCDAVPYIPAGWEIRPEDQLSSAVRGQVRLADLQKIELYRSESQKAESEIPFEKVREELVGQPVLKAFILDYWLDQPGLIPKSLDGKWMSFWGTVYRDAVCNLAVRYLYKDEEYGIWRWASISFNERRWGISYPPAAILPKAS